LGAKLIKMKKTKSLITLLLAIVILTGCKKEGGVLGGSTTPMGQVGNTFNVYPLASVPGVGDITVEVIDLVDGISTLQYNVPITNVKLSNIFNALAAISPSQVDFANDTLKGNISLRFTNEGISSVYKNGELIIAKYNAKVGDEYKMKFGDNTVKHTVVDRSTEDDFWWAGGLIIKVIRVEATGHNLPGLDKITYYLNHRFGLVGITLHFADSTLISADFESSADNF
jgi:PBP1b-binding outer membrane lipoprotein LpoB